MRTADDLCLLCLEQKASKMNSHIASKFLGKSMLGAGNKKVGYTIDTGISSKPPKKGQDSAKENYILCPECEEYFSHLENYVSNKLNTRILNSEFDSEFNYHISDGNIEYAECLSLDTGIMRLFIISLFWRASISSAQLYKVFKIKEEEQFRSILFKYSLSSYSDLLALKFDDDIYAWPITLFRVKATKDSTKNVMNANDRNDNMYMLLLNEYNFGISTLQDSELKKFEFLNNQGKENFKVGLFAPSIWDGLIKKMLNLTAQLAVKKARKNGGKPFWEK